jgi:opacity protein-like surface antigen
MMTKKIIISIAVLAVLLACMALTSYAQQPYPKVEVFGGYSLEYLGLSDNDLSTIKSDLINLGATSVSSSKWLKAGFAGSFTYNVTKSFGIEADVRWNRGNVVTAQIAGVSAAARVTDLPVLFGPSFAFRGKSKAIPFVHVLFGLDHASIGGTGSAAGHNVSIGTSSSNGFGLAAGGGLDLKVSKLIAIRVIQADYYYSRPYSTNLNNFNLAFGAVFNFGGK